MPTSPTAYFLAEQLPESPPRILRNLFSPTPSKRRKPLRVSNNIRIVSIAPLIGEAIARTAKEESVSSLFD